jgi:hypothetical protein
MADPVRKKSFTYDFAYATGVGTTTLVNATILNDLVGGPLYDAWSYTYADQAAARAALLGLTGGCLMVILPYIGTSSWIVDVNVDGLGKPTMTVTAAAIVPLVAASAKLNLLHVDS